MTALRRILCPVDFSEPSRRALALAFSLAKSVGARVTALHVMFDPFDFRAPGYSAEPVGEKTRVVERDCRELELREWMHALHGGDVLDGILVEEGPAAARIADLSDPGHADLVVMGTHGLSGFDRLALGSVTEKVLRKARCPVLTVSPASPTVPHVPFTRLLCPVDFSESAKTALQVACRLADEAGVTILHVVDWPDDESLFEQVAVPEYRHILEKDAEARVNALAAEHTRAGRKPLARIAHGKPYREILKNAQEEQVDLIVMGVRGRNPLDLAFFGSTTNQVVRHASCPVLTVRQ
jgi:nucleotide-binding universal stress UspA family protein